MPATVATFPTYAVPGRKTSVIFTPANGNANFVRVWATTAPEGTAIRKQIDASKLNRSLVFEGRAGADHPWRHTFEKGGAYTLLLQEYERGNSWGGGYDRDPRGAPSETTLGSEQSLTLYIAQRMTQTLGVNPDTATLVVYVVNDTIRETVAAVHGEATPAIVDPSSDKANIAASDATVLTQLATLKDDDVWFAAVFTNFLDVNGFMDDFMAHAASASFHQSADAHADLASFKVPAAGQNEPSAAADPINKLRERYSLHIRNSTVASPTPGSVTTHNQSSQFIDSTNELLPITADAGDPTTVVAAMADWLRAYERHRVAAMHETTDSTNSAATTSPLVTLHRRFLEALVAVPTAGLPAIPGQSSGATLLKATGFEES